MAGRYLRPEELVKHYQSPSADLPQRGGVKDYAPDGSWIEGKRLEVFYKERHEVLSEERIKQVDHLASGEWRPELRKVEVIKDTGKFFFKMGHVDNKMQLLHPEEALFLLDQGMIEIYYGGVPLSLQEAYPTLLGKDVPLEYYHVYAHLSRLGFIIRRHESSSQLTKYERDIRLGQHRKMKRGKKSEKTASKRQLEDGSHLCNAGGKLLRADDHAPGNLNSHADEASNSLAVTGQGRPSDTDTSNEKSEVDAATSDACMGVGGHGDNGYQGDNHRLCPFSADSVTTKISEGLSCEVPSTGTKWWFPEDFGQDTAVPHLESLPQRSWEASDIRFPDASNCDTLELVMPDTTLISSGIRFGGDKKSLLVKNLNITKESSRHNSSSLEFSLPRESWVKHDDRLQPAVNWKQYKERQRRDALRAVEESPVSHLWTGKVQPLLRPEDAQSTDMVLRKLKIIPSYDMLQVSSGSASKPSEVKVVYDIFRPDSKFRKTCATVPDHRVCVTRQEDPVPDLAALATVARQYRDGVPVVWGVVDSGDVAFYSFNATDLPTDIFMP